MKKILLLAACLMLVSSPSFAQLINGDFSMGPVGWTVWDERGPLTFDTSAGDGWTYSGNYNGGIYQTFAVTPGVTYTVSGTVASDPYIPGAMWAEVIMINSASQIPIPGQDLSPNGVSVILMAKEDSWASGPWNESFDQMGVAPLNLSFTAADNFATIVLKSGNIGNGDTGVRWDDVQVVPEPASMIALAMGLGGLVLRRKS